MMESRRRGPLRKALDLLLLRCACTTNIPRPGPGSKAAVGDDRPAGPLRVASFRTDDDDDDCNDKLTIIKVGIKVRRCHRVVVDMKCEATNERTNERTST